MASIVERNELSEIKMSIVISVPNLANKFVAAANALAEPSRGSASSGFFSANGTYSFFLRKDNASKMDSIVEHDELSEVKMSIVISVPNFPNKFIAVVQAFDEPSGAFASSELFSAKETFS